MSAAVNVTLGRIAMRNPVMTASGTSGYGQELAEFFELKALGAFVTKAITRAERLGNETPRLVETRAGMVNAIGLANVGLEVFLKDKLPWLREQGVPVIVNVAGSTIDEYVAVASALDGAEGVDGLELNISCPNVKAGGLEFGRSDKAIRDVVGAVRQAVKRATLIVKLTPNVTDITAMARAAIEAGAEALTLINTLSGLVINARTRRPVLANVFGGLSGPAIKPVALKMVYDVYRTVAREAGVPIIGVGGIQTGADAVEFLLAGATAVQVGTATFVDPRASVDVAAGIASYLDENGFENVSELIGGLRVG
ncbi:MAG TPA: dihydroorotate dehydrogenase [Phycisphaerae bacterium]|nr:dihydroorotate dehydrogenase [Phycisphaerae bacterium]HOI55082.1 dihydroorotate dehydrogenase [Phycisphaerae bacterium]